MSTRHIVPAGETRLTFEVYVAQTAVTKGDNVVLHTDNIKVVTAPTSAPQALTVGIALEDAAAGEQVGVGLGIVSALVDGTTVDADVGDALVPSTTTAGELESSGAAPVDTAVTRFVAVAANTGATALTLVRAV